MPPSNGQAERGVQVIKRLLVKNTCGSLKIRLANCLLYYRNVPHSVTNVAPSVALNGRKYVTVKERVNPSFVPTIKCKPKTFQSFEVGDTVYALNLRQGHKWLKAIVVEKLGLNVYSVLLDSSDLVWRRHAGQLLSRIAFEKSETHVPSGVKTSNNYDIDSRTEFPPLPTGVSNRERNIPSFPSEGQNQLLVPNPSEGSGDNIDPNVSEIEIPPNVNSDSSENQIPLNNPVIDMPFLRRSTRISKPVERYIESC